MVWLEQLRDMDPEHELLPGVTAGAVVELATIPPDPSGAVLHRDVEYGRGGLGGPPLHLDVYARSDTSDRRPGVVLVHGGGWFSGARSGFLRHAYELAALGFVSATVTYRLHDQALWPAAIEDVKCAVRWMRANAEDLGVDPSRIAAAGASAGGHLSALTALRPGWHEGSGGHAGQSSEVQAAVLYYPATDVRALTGLGTEPSRRIGEYFGHPGPDHRAEASPVEHVHAGAPPIMTLTGDADLVTTVETIREFHERLSAAGVRNELHVFPGKGHAFANLPGSWHDCFALMAGFLHREL